MLLKGIGEVEAAGRPVDAAEMVLVRIAYAADLPTPDEVIRSLGETPRGNGTGATTPSPVASPRAELRSESPRGTRGTLASVAPVAAPSMDEPVARDEHGRPTRAVKSFEDLIALA